MSNSDLSGRGTSANPANRYERVHIESDLTDEAAPSPGTTFLKDASRSILSANDSPDVPFTYSINPYRGCEHGCVYCYARPSHEYLSFSAGLDFETKILVKHDAPELLRVALRKPSWQPQVIALSGNTDCYQPAERQLQLTRRCLQVLAEFRNPVGIITKSALVVRDIDILRELAAVGAAHVTLSITTLDRDLARRLEPRAAQPERRLEALRALSEAGIPTSVNVAPLIPGLNDEEIPRILAAAADAGAGQAAYVLLRLPKPVDVLFEQWVKENFPDRQARILGRIRECRSGFINDPRFKSRMRGEGVYAEQLGSLFRAAARHAGLDRPFAPLNVEAFRRPPQPGDQLGLW